jgi:cysteinyl-tRNA synthetase
MGYLDKIIDAGFDGVYLDIIDAYEFWGEGGESGVDRRTAPREMVQFVKRIAAHAQKERGKPDFAIVPQNGEGLSRFPDYVDTITAIAKEDLFYNDNHPQPATETREALRHLAVFHSAGKPVLVVDYVTRPALAQDLYQRARALGFIPYATVRELNVLTRNARLDP